MSCPTAGACLIPATTSSWRCSPKQLGADSLWVSHHVIHAGFVGERLGTGNYYDPLISLAAAAMATTTPRLGTSVLVLGYLNPLITAKQLATIDWLSHGRVDAGVGVGDLRPEFDVARVAFDRSRRVRRRVHRGPQAAVGPGTELVQRGVLLVRRRRVVPGALPARRSAPADRRQRRAGHPPAARPRRRLARPRPDRCAAAAHRRMLKESASRGRARDGGFPVPGAAARRCRPSSRPRPGGTRRAAYAEAGLTTWFWRRRHATKTPTGAGWRRCYRC